MNESPVTTQVPPFSHGFGRQLEFLAENRERKVKFAFVSELSQTTKRIISTIMNLNPTQTAFDWAFFSLLLPDSLNFPFSYALYSLTLKCTVSAIRHFKHTSVGTQRRERNGRDESGRES